MGTFKLCEETVSILWYESCEKYKWAVQVKLRVFRRVHKSAKSDY